MLAEDAALLREGLVGILERAGHEVVAAVGDADALLAVRRAQQPPDVVVTDVRMPPEPHRRGAAGGGPRSGPSTRTSRSWCCRQYVAEAYVPELLDAAPDGGRRLPAEGPGRARRASSSTALDRVAAGGTVVDPEVVGSCSAGAATTGRWPR